MAHLALIAGIAGKVIAGVGTIVSGISANESAKYEAKQLDMKGAEERAAAQRDAAEQRTQTGRVTSRQQALAASSGFSATDDTILNLEGDTAQAGAYRAGMITYGGESRAAGLTAQAKGARMSGKAALIGSIISGTGQAVSGLSSLSKPKPNNTILGGYSSMAGKYGGTPPISNELDNYIYGRPTYG